MQWYSDHRRDLPWRSAPSPYGTLVSEAMLQQTQVDRVIPRYVAFMQRWPTVEALASAPRSEVVAEWSGLGYNARAVRLHEAARTITSDGWPTTAEDLARLPGVGPYTAAAIASIGFGEHVAAVDTNLRRVLSRWAGEPLSGAPLRTVAAAWVGSPAGEWNQAVMDLGATMCRPRSPRCDRCPVRSWCADPNVYEPPRRQGRFEGSNRQLRGALVRAYATGADPLDAGLALGRSAEEVHAALGRLVAEGLLPDDPAQTVAGS
jgi:A/G-specific adenine glycosylase